MKSAVNVPTQQQLLRIFHKKYGSAEDLDWGPGLRRRFGYLNPDDWYETIVYDLVTSGIKWLDIGCGRDIFPSNRLLAAELSKKCHLLVGVDPDPTILENPFLHESQNVVIEDFQHDEKFDLITLRMVAEHFENPQSVAAIPDDRSLRYTGGMSEGTKRRLAAIN